MEKSHIANGRTAKRISADGSVDASLSTGSLDIQDLITHENNGDSDDLGSSYLKGSSAHESETFQSGGDGGRGRAAPVQAESRMLSSSRRMVGVFFCLAAAAASTLTYLYVSDDDKETTKIDQFSETAELVKIVTQRRYEETVRALDRESVTATLAASSTEHRWPFVVLPELPSWMGNGRTLTVLVTEAQRTEWNAFTQSGNTSHWIEESMTYSGHELPANYSTQLSPTIWNYDGVEDSPSRVQARGDAMYAVSWQSTFPFDITEVNHNDFDHSFFRDLYDELISDPKLLVSDLVKEPNSSPSSWWIQPVFGHTGTYTPSSMTAYIKLQIEWGVFFDDILDDSSQSMHVVLKSTSCSGQVLSLELDSESVTPLGEADVHDAGYDSSIVDYDFPTTLGGCNFRVYVYPSTKFETETDSENATIYSAIAAAIVLVPFLAFLAHDCVARRYQQWLAKSVTEYATIVHDLYPENVRQGLLEQESRSFRKFIGKGKRGEQDRDKWQKKDVSPAKTLATQNESETFETDQGTDILSVKPNADFFPHCTVLFADVVGFTAWSSVRDPTQVFTLLETLYSCFDKRARKLKVFKVETIGDCYVAVTGLPEAMDNHAVVMTRFAQQCMSKMHEIVRELESYLGPDTGDLSMRFGLHSGPVTAGVMRGERARFQLFGDTVNTAARIESTGAKGKIHLSAETADLLVESGKSHWVKQRSEQVSAKGKGTLQTYWAELSPAKLSDESQSLGGFSNSVDDLEMPGLAGHGGVGSLVARFEKTEKVNNLGDQTRRQAQYTVEVMARILKKIVASRGGKPKQSFTKEFRKYEAGQCPRTGIIGEVAQAIDFQKPRKVTAAGSLELPAKVLHQLNDFVATIASKYRGHAFHCFEHANHVTMSATKLYSRLAQEEQGVRTLPAANGSNATRKTSQQFKDESFGLTNDPVTEFALVFSSIIHDVDHPGTPNTRLVKENSPLVRKFGKQSPAEQNSLCLAWEIFMKQEYDDLRALIYTNKSELARFRQLVVNLVMATDVLDKTLSSDRKGRWRKAFQQARSGIVDLSDQTNRKATVVLEYLMQASDVAHTTQHWNVYIKWNRRLFEETYEGYRNGGQKDPADYWYDGELHFFDDVVIPLAEKLKESGAFGEDAEEFVNYAKANRRDWQLKGRDTILDYVAGLKGVLPNGKSTKGAN